MQNGPKSVALHFEQETFSFPFSIFPNPEFCLPGAQRTENWNLETRCQKRETAIQEAGSNKPKPKKPEAETQETRSRNPRNQKPKPKKQDIGTQEPRSRNPGNQKPEIQTRDQRLKTRNMEPGIMKPEPRDREPGGHKPEASTPETRSQ